MPVEVQYIKIVFLINVVSTSSQQVELVVVWRVCHAVQSGVLTVIEAQAHLTLLCQNTQQNLDMNTAA